MLNLVTPERFDGMLTDDTVDLCKDTCDNFYQPMEIGFPDKLNWLLLGKLGWAIH
jgi:hypothetical protein